MVNDVYNDLGLKVGNKLIILVEAQRRAIGYCVEKGILRDVLLSKKKEVDELQGKHK